MLHRMRNFVSLKQKEYGKREGTNTLTLPIKKKWFDMILSSEKKEEYRDLTPYYKSRFRNVFAMVPGTNSPAIDYPKEVAFRNGYGKNAPEIIAKCNLDIKKGKAEWGAELGKDYYVLTILEIVEVKNLKESCG